MFVLFMIALTSTVWGYCYAIKQIDKDRAASRERWDKFTDLLVKVYSGCATEAERRELDAMVPKGEKRRYR